MLYIRMRKPTLNVQTVSIRAKVFCLGRLL